MALIERRETLTGEDGAARPARGTAPMPALLCVANFPANTGYAWDFIEALYAGIADRLAPLGVRTFVAYPRVAAPPRTLAGSAARPVELDVRFDSIRGVRATLSFVRRHGVTVLYLADREAWHPAYALLRLGGVKLIVVHDHTSGERRAPTGARRAIKEATRHARACLADEVIAVSDYVLRRKLAVDLVPRARARRVWNSIEPPARDPGAAARLRRELRLPQDALVVVGASRATGEKGIHHLLRAFDSVVDSWTGPGEAPWLVYMGDGPSLQDIQAVRESLPHRDRIVLPGHRADARVLLAGADVCVVPSVWQEAFGLAALEPMSAGVPVVVTRVGGLPEVVVDEVTGLVVAPGSEPELARALERLLRDRALRQRLGVNGRRRARERFGRRQQIDELTRILMTGLNLDARTDETAAPALELLAGDSR